MNMKSPLYSSCILLFLILLSLSSYAQGSFVFRGRVQKSDKIEQRDVTLPNATVALYKGDKKTFVKTDKNGEFEFKDLEYGNIYKVVFKAPTCIEMFLLIDANVPEKRKEYTDGVQSNFIMYDSKEKGLNIKKFNYPFMKIAYNGKGLLSKSQCASSKFSFGKACSTNNTFLFSNHFIISSA